MGAAYTGRFLAVGAMMTRRQLLTGAAGIGAHAAQAPAATRFQIGCMTLPYSGFPFARAISGIAAAGYRYAGWGPNHLKQPTLAPDAPPSQAKELAGQTRAAGLDPVLMFSGIYIEAPEG